MFENFTLAYNFLINPPSTLSLPVLFIFPSIFILRSLFNQLSPFSAIRTGLGVRLFARAQVVYQWQLFRRKSTPPNSYQLPTAHQLRVNIALSPHPQFHVGNTGFRETVHVLCSQPWLVWVLTCNSSVLSWKHCFTMVLYNLSLLDALCFLLWWSTSLGRRGCDVDILFKAEHPHSLFFSALWPVHCESLD